MDDLISRQAAIDAINALHEKPNAWLDYAVDAIMTLPSAQPDAVPVVRCEHCAHKKNCQWYYYSGDDYGYCSWAVREEE